MAFDLDHLTNAWREGRLRTLHLERTANGTRIMVEVAVAPGSEREGFDLTVAPEEAALSHRLFTAALESQRESRTVAVCGTAL